MLYLISFLWKKNLISFWVSNRYLFCYVSELETCGAGNRKKYCVNSWPLESTLGVDLQLVMEHVRAMNQSFRIVYQNCVLKLVLSQVIKEKSYFYQNCVLKLVFSQVKKKKKNHIFLTTKSTNHYTVAQLTKLLDAILSCSSVVFSYVFLYCQDQRTAKKIKMIISHLKTWICNI